MPTTASDRCRRSQPPDRLTQRPGCCAGDENRPGCAGLRRRSPGGSKDLSVQIRNEGDSDLLVTDLLGDWVDGTFVLDPTDNFPLSPIAPQTETRIGITFDTPTTAGQQRAAEWQVLTDPAQTPAPSFSLTGSSIGPHIEVSPDFIDFGTIQQPPSIAEFRVRNIGTHNLNITSVEVRDTRSFAVVYHQHRSPSPPARSSKFRSSSTPPRARTEADA